MNFKWLGPLALLAVLFIGDQIRINRPGHKYRLTLEVETPEGIKSGSSILSVHPDRGYSRHGHTTARGDAVFLDFGGGKNLVGLLAHIDKKIDLDGINYVALRAYNAAGGKRVSFNEMSKMQGVVPVTGELIPLLATFTDPANPATMRTVPPDHLDAVLVNGFRLKGVSAEIVPNGFWPVDFGGTLGQPVTRAIADRLPWVARPDDAAAALKAADLQSKEPIDAREVFTRK